MSSKEGFTGRTERQIGAEMLGRAGFRGRHGEIVDHSFDRARAREEKLVGQKDERRIDAYLGRLERGEERYGERYTDKVWQKTLDHLIIKPENITDNYWRTQEQILRDEGQGRTLSEREKEYLTEDIQKQQYESAKTWVDYLSHEECPYPTWFKVYAIDGMSKMGGFDKNKGIYKKRDKETVAPYPHLNPATLGKLYEVITDYYKIDTDQDLNGREDNAHEMELEDLIKSGNFNKLYTKLLLSEKMIMKTPERTEDIHGEWIEYKAGDEEEVAALAEGTPWCIAAPAVARSYLQQGRYGEVYDENEFGDESKARFLLLRLYDEDGRLADNACASIRLDEEGAVAEISGLEEGQALEDALVPIVEEKVKTLPGGERYLAAFADKERLIRLDRKMQAGEDISEEDFRFIHELDRPIKTLDTYNYIDPRVDELRKKYGSEYAKEKALVYPDTKVEDIEGKTIEYLANDIELDSNLLTYVLKQKYDKEPEEFKKILVESLLRESGEGELDREEMQKKIERIFGRIEKLETYETEHYTFLLPLDKWEEGKIRLPGEEEKYIAPTNLTAILKKAVKFDWDYETDGEKSGVYNLQGDAWVGMEIQHFPWSKELLETNETFLKENGFEIPVDWKPIVDGIGIEIASEKGGTVVEDSEVVNYLGKKLSFRFAGYYDYYDNSLGDQSSNGYYWSASASDSNGAYHLRFYSSAIFPQSNYFYKAVGISVRCVAGS